MNVLLIGGASSMVNNLIIKLNKEKHRVFLLTGDRFGNLSYQKVFEKYPFPYTSSNLNEIFESINPDLTIFMGAHDTNFDWGEEEKDSVRYNAGLMNILVNYARMGRGRFVYLSSDEVYQSSYEEDITEDIETDPEGFRSMVLAQGEEMCERYQRTMGLDIITLRLDHLYGIPESARDIRDICNRMCLEALDTGTITIREEYWCSLLFEKDAVEYIYQAGVCENHQNSLYNISSDYEISERQIAEIIQSHLKKTVEIIVKGAGENRRVLSGSLYESEFGTPFFCDLSENIQKILDRMRKERHIFLHGEEKKLPFYQRFLKKTGWLIKELIPFAENMVAFIPFFMLNNRAVGSEYFAKLDFYLIYVLLFAIVYGQQQAAVSAVLAVAGYCFRQMYDRSGFELMLDANTYVWIAQLFILGLTVGYMRDTISKMHRENEDEKEFLTLQLKDIHDINSSNVRVKDALETQLINQSDSVGRIYSITSALDYYSSEEVLFYAAQVLGKLMKSKDVAVYVVSNENYARLFSATSPKARQLGHSIRYQELTEMYEALIEHKVYINRNLDDKYPHMASAIYDDQERMQVIAMIWGLPWDSMTLGQANQLVIIGALIQSAVVRANRYLAALEERRFVEGTHTMQTEAFTALIKAYFKAREQGLVECVLLRICTEDQGRREAGVAVSEKMRQTDYIGILEDGELYVLLANTDKSGVPFVVKRLKEAGYESVIVEDEEQ